MGSTAAVLPQVNAHDLIVGCAVLPLSASLLQDQHPHSVWLPLQPPSKLLLYNSVVFSSYCVVMLLLYNSIVFSIHCMVVLLLNNNIVLST